LISGSVSPLDESAQPPPINICQVWPSAITPPLRLLRLLKVCVIADLPPVSRVRADRHHPPERPYAEASMDGPDNGVG
jgi:hypothetical protein